MVVKVDWKFGSILKKIAKEFPNLANVAKILTNLVTRFAEEENNF